MTPQAPATAHTECRFFDGYRPCRFQRPCEGCPHLDVPEHRVLLVNLDALGDVLRTTALLAPLHRALPGAHVTWLTSHRALPLLDHVPGIDRAIALSPWTASFLQTLQFDYVLGVDKSLAGGSLTMAARAVHRRGFGLDSGGAIVPLNPEAVELYELGLDNRRKFVDNRKTENQLLCEAMGWPYQQDPYRVTLSEEEQQGVQAWRREQGMGDGDVAIGLNTGCSAAYPNKRLEVGAQAELLDRLAARCPDATLVLLGGPEDGERNRRIAAATKARPVLSPTDEGLRRGLQMVAACDVVLSGDSLGMHMAIGLGKLVIAWFGLSCHQEIGLYGRGSWVLADVACRPCWQRRCEREPRCFRRVPLDSMVQQAAEMALSVQQGRDWNDEVLVGSWPSWPIE